MHLPPPLKSGVEYFEHASWMAVSRWHRKTLGVESEHSESYHFWAAMSSVCESVDRRTPQRALSVFFVG